MHSEWRRRIHDMRDPGYNFSGIKFDCDAPKKSVVYLCRLQAPACESLREEWSLEPYGVQAIGSEDPEDQEGAVTAKQPRLEAETETTFNAVWQSRSCPSGRWFLRGTLTYFLENNISSVVQPTSIPSDEEFTNYPVIPLEFEDIRLTQTDLNKGASARRPKRNRSERNPQPERLRIPKQEYRLIKTNPVPKQSLIKINPVPKTEPQNNGSPNASYGLWRPRRAGQHGGGIVSGQPDSPPRPSTSSNSSNTTTVSRERFNNVELRRVFAVPPARNIPDLAQFYDDVMLILREMADEVRGRVRRNDVIQLE
ncbi:hypothetical protein D9C73_027926 [Collichthys lucidus]|uniref:Uncharacterized protein n=1 Tax=Collichthys lucidus TaxID=240159 RepID=A0A4U5TW92_COLLU|nr:hypothetical protein D9C73_027926 [Collichthys lucidus]